MKSIVCINTQIPTAEKYVSYMSGESLRDYDIAVFDPYLPRLERVEFSGGGSCIAIEAASRLRKAMSHWSSEFQGALEAGKTIFVILNDYVSDLAAYNSTVTKNTRSYQTSDLNNYQIVPGRISVTNAKGQKITIRDGAYRGLYDTIKDIAHYRVIITSTVTKQLYTTKDGATIGAVVKLRDAPGHLVLLPYFDFNNERFAEDKLFEVTWTEAGLKASKAFVSQLVAVDKMLRGSAELSPPPNWVSDMPIPRLARSLDEKMAELNEEIRDLQERCRELAQSKTRMLEFSHLLYETGKPLEKIVEKALVLLGYACEPLRIGDLEIDHVIVGPSGKRMIGESEGKDTSAVDITKFRQLESNIGEDFQRDEVDEPAKGILFGNGFRLTNPSERTEQFTQKSLINARRLGSALIRTADLYPVVVYLLDNPDDESFKLACRSAIEQTAGGIVEFPNP